MKLFISAISKYLIGLLFAGTLLFLPAGTLQFWNAWLFIALLFIPVLLLGIFLFIKNPSLLERRLDAKEKNKTQGAVVKAAGLMFFIGFIVAGLDRRFSWSSLPAWLVVLSSVILLISYALYAEVMRENAFLSRTIEIQEKQTVITTGLYGYVRHPMYSVTIFLFLSIPFVLGSWVSLIFFLPYLPLIVIRIFNEEKFLEKNLNGYKDYKKKVKYRLIPHIW